MIFRQYNPKLVQVIWAGIRFQGFASGSKVSVEMAEDDFEMVKGCDGDVTLVQNQNPTGSITVRLMAESPTNDLLSVRAITSRKVVPVVAPVLVANLNGTTRCKAAYGVLRRLPPVDYADEAGVREWVILCADLEEYVGGALV